MTIRAQYINQKVMVFSYLNEDWSFSALDSLKDRFSKIPSSIF